MPRAITSSITLKMQPHECHKKGRSAAWIRSMMRRYCGMMCCADNARGDERAGLEAQVVAEAADGEDVGVLAQEALPDRGHQVADAAIEIGEQRRVVGLHVGQRLEADQVLADLQHAVAHPAQRLHAGRQMPAQRVEARLGHRPVARRQLGPGIAFEVGAVLDRPLAAHDRAVARQDIGDAHLVGDGVVSHLRPEAAVVAEEFVQILS